MAVKTVCVYAIIEKRILSLIVAIILRLMLREENFFNFFSMLIHPISKSVCLYSESKLKEAALVKRLKMLEKVS